MWKRDSWSEIRWQLEKPHKDYSGESSNSQYGRRSHQEPAEAGTTYLANARGPAFRRSKAKMRPPRTLCAHCALERWGETLSEL